MSDADQTNILIVDDLGEKILAYRSILEDLGQNIVAARSGEEALGHVLRTDFAVILLDVNMPPGMDGFETAALIRKRRKSAHTPIIFLTAFADEVRAAEGYAHGAVDYIPTPVVPAILRAKVRVFVDLYRMTQQVRRQAEERVALAEERTRRAAAEETNRRLAFLAKTGAVLGQTLDYRVTARDVARLAVPDLAGWAALVLTDPRGGDWQVFAASAGGGDGPSVEEGTGRESLPADMVGPVERMLGGAEPDRMQDSTTVVFPLRARGRPIGALALARDAAGPGFRAADLAVTEALADRAAVALENARLYQHAEDADKQKNEFLSMLAHELRNPLAPLQNAAEIIRRRAPDEPQLRWAREVIHRQLRQMVRLVDDLLDVSRITRGKITLQLAPTDLADVIAHAVEASRPVIDAAGHRLELAVPPGPLWVNGDAARLAQVLTNLLNNAAKYTEPGGRIWLDAGRDDGAVVVRVRDTGVGIPREMLAAVFELFTQIDRTLERSQGGLGIGLTLVRRLVAKHGGTVEARSDGPGRGSEFIVRLPAGASGVQQAEPTGEAGERADRRLSVLVVDDNKDAAESLADLLQSAGYEVRVVHDGPAALSAVDAFRPHAVVLDIGLPGMTGFEVARRLRARAETRDAVIVALTGYGRDEDRAHGRAAGFDHHLVKPVPLSVLRPLLDPAGGRPS